ncbi:1609_t:CDS:2, partial [Gigaspora margarita]
MSSKPIYLIRFHKGSINRSACMKCRQLKIKCDGNIGTKLPCTNCDAGTCAYDNRNKRGIRKLSMKHQVKKLSASEVDRFRRPYISTACSPCKRAKTKCLGGVPCDRCARNNIECMYVNKSRSRNVDEPLEFKSDNIVVNESPMICSLCGILGKFTNQYYQCETCINEFGLGSSGNQIIDEFLKSKGDQFLWIPYNCFLNIIYLSKGGFGMVYKANWNRNEVVLKSLYNSDNINIDFLEEANSHKKFMNYNGVVQIYGITLDPFKKSYMMVMKYVSGGDLYSFLKKSYTKLTWKNKLALLLDITK